MNEASDDIRRPAVDQSFEVTGGAAEATSAAIEGLSHAGPFALIAGVIALVGIPVAWLLRRRPGA